MEAHQVNSSIRKDVEDYTTARRNGLHPETVSQRDIRKAYREADAQ